MGYQGLMVNFFKLNDSSRNSDIGRVGIVSRVEDSELRRAFEALRSGVKKVHILDCCIKHTLLLELFTNEGVGTELVVDS